MQSTKTNELTVVAVHGNGGGAFRFELVKPFVPADINFQAITLPGFADTPPDPDLKSLHDYAVYLSRFCALLPRPLVLLGHGIGGTIILELAQHFSGSFDGIILHAPVGARLESRLFPFLMAIPGARRLGQFLFSSKFARPIFKKLLFSHPVPTDYINRFFDEYRHCSVFAQMFDLISPEWFNGLRPLTTPAVVLWGKRERVLNAGQADDYRLILPKGRIVLVSDWDHFPMIEQPEDYMREISTLARDLVRSQI
jgi:pimeloyl-ACP methyl ester carboxylesterase